MQRYKCAACGKRFLGGNRIRKDIVWREYTEGKQTYAQLAEKYGCCIKILTQSEWIINQLSHALSMC